MILNQNLLRFLIINAVALCCHSVYGSFDQSSSTQSFQVQNEELQKQVDQMVTANLTDEPVQKFQICPEGQYVAGCRNYRVGFNWLKSAEVPDLETSNRTRINMMTTRNYYTGDTTALFEQMRIFFGGKDSTVIVDADGNTVTEQDFIKDREAILNNLCRPYTDSSVKSVIKCQPCPPNDSENQADIPESYVWLNGDNKIIPGTWHFYTIADCYMKTFTDSTGTYFYVPDEAVSLESAGQESAETCYYNNTNPGAMDALNGDAIKKFVIGINTEQLIDDQQSVVVPASGFVNK